MPTVMELLGEAGAECRMSEYQTAYRGRAAGLKPQLMTEVLCFRLLDTFIIKLLGKYTMPKWYWLWEILFGLIQW